MCGIAGLVAKRALTAERFDEFVRSSGLMRHRGPDNQSVIRLDNILLIHQRLSIIDLDARANQPFFSASGRHVTVYNGEIYNYREIAEHLSAELTTSSDTEVMLESFEQDGVSAIESWNGIFAAAIYDKASKRLYLCRDRFGVKPLYVYESDDVLAFASEAKVILDWLPDFSIDSKVLSQFLWYGNSTGRAGFVKGLYKVSPGMHLSIDARTGLVTEEQSFWSLKNVAQIRLSQFEAVDETRRLLELAVKRQLVADVPLGVLLSGGVDSSSIVAFAARHYGKTLDTYAVHYDFDSGGASELARAAEVATKFETNHTELHINTGHVEEIFADLVFQYDEPFADSASIPLYQLAKECSKDKRVVLQGDGGDELFAGYRRYNVMSSYWFWRTASSVFHGLPSGLWRERLKRVNAVLNRPTRAGTIAYYLSEEAPYSRPFDVISDDFRNNISEDDWSDDYIEVANEFTHLDRVQQLLYTDMAILLPCRYLEKVDKATMLCSVEARVPFLDNDLAEFALSLPSDLKVRRGTKKFILKKALDGLVPSSVLNAPKRGFDVPVRQWLTDGLYDFARNQFVAHDMGILNSDRLLALLDSHRDEGLGSTALLWKCLILAQWIKTYQSKIIR
jgi:asparagine synthase (glutamine-hydrolysing)